MAGGGDGGGRAFLLYGAVSYQTPTQSNRSLGIGAGLILLGLGLEWRAMDLHSLTFQRYDDYLRSRLASPHGDGR